MAASITLVSVTSTAGALATVAPGSRVSFVNQGANPAYIGTSASVSSSTGLLFAPNAALNEVECSSGPGDNWYAISASGTTIAVITGV
jgi:hypothetical protein